MDRKFNRLKEIARITGVVFHFDDPKFIWPYVPRTASRCMRATLEGMGLKLELLGNRYGEWPEQVTPETLNEYYLWTFVRNPFDKVVSAMTYFQLTPSIFVAKNHRYIKEGFQDVPRMVGTHMIPNTFFTHIEDEMFIDFIGRYEHIHADWKALLSVLDLSHSHLLDPHKWMTKHKPYKEYYNDNLMYQTVKDMYKDDFRILDYDPNIF